MPKTAKPYNTSDRNTSFTAKQLVRQNKEIKLDVMKTWFLDNYTDPVNCCPYISSEGGYQYIWGGPYDAQEILSDEFIGEKYESLIKTLEEELSSDSPYWSPIPEPSEEDFEHYFSENTKLDDIYAEFITAINDIEILLNTNIEKKQKQNFYRLVYANIITALETYLSDTFIKLVTENGSFRLPYVAHKARAENSSYKITDALSEKMNKADKNHLQYFVWHRLEKTERLYRNVLDITFCNYINFFVIPIKNRHDIIHRNGKSTDGNILTLTKNEIKKLSSTTKKFVTFLKAEINKKINSPTEKKAHEDVIEDDSPY